MPAADALTVRTALREQCDQNLFQQYVETTVDETIKTNSISDRDFHVGLNLDAMRHALNAAETFYVSPNMHTLVRMAAEDFPLKEIIRRDDAPSDVGFLWLPEALTIEAENHDVQRVHAMLWSSRRVWLIGDFLDPQDWQRQDVIEHAGQDYFDNLIRESGRYNLAGILTFKYNEAIPTVMKYRDMHGGRYFDVDLLGGDVLPKVQNAETMTYLLATWRMMQQSMTHIVREESEIPRGVRRRAERAHLPKMVSVIQLRRREVQGGHGGTGEGINYRTTVRGHWRKVWCGPMDGERYQRAVYIHPFWRGPEGAPVIVRDRVNALTR